MSAALTPFPTNQADSSAPLHVAALLWGALLTAAAVNAAFHVEAERGDLLIRDTIRLALAYYFVAAVLMLRLRPAEWLDSPASKLARCCWSLAWLAFALHVAAAYHFFHHWNQGHALEHTRAISGVAWGLFVSYAFTALWGLDALAWWFWPGWYASRPAWVGWTVHGFMAFILFNGTVVYEKGLIVWAGAAMFLVLGTLLLRRLLAAQEHSGPLADRPLQGGCMNRFGSPLVSPALQGWVAAGVILSAGLQPLREGFSP